MVEETIRMANIAAMVFRLAIKEFEYKGTELNHNFQNSWQITRLLRERRGGICYYFKLNGHFNFKLNDHYSFDVITVNRRHQYIID